MTAPGVTVETDWCPSCEVAVDEPIRIYECSTCGERDDERRCTQCNRFKARAEEDGCPECFGEVEPASLVMDHDGALVQPGEYQPDGEAAAVRNARASKEAAARRKNERQAAHGALLERSTATTWGQVAAGDQVVPSEAPRYTAASDPDTVLRASAARDGQRVVVVIERYSRPRIEVYPADEPVRVLPERDDTIDEFGAWVLLDEAPLAASSPMKQIEVSLQDGTTETGLLPTLTIWATNGFNFRVPIGQWVDPDLASRALDVMDTAVERLRAMPGATSSDTPQVTVVRDGFPLIGNLAIRTEVKVGNDPWQDAPLVDFVANRTSVSVADATTLAAAITEARGLLDGLTLTPWREA